ncbi:MAG: hypothetical protein ACYCZV_12225, partial [Acidimicrobiales bacterium]
LHRQPRALRRRPTQPRYRLLRVIPVRRHPIRFTEDPREWIYEKGGSPNQLLKGWRSLRRAQRKALGTVIYARLAFRLPERGARRSWSDVGAVAFRASIRDPWVTDWDALELAERWQLPELEALWQGSLDQDHQRLLEVMRQVHGDWAIRRHRQIGRVAEGLLARRHWSSAQADQAWIRELPTQPRERQMYEVAVGRGHEARLLGRTDSFGKAEAMAAAGIERARDALAQVLIEQGGLAAELAGARERWPEAKVTHVPPFYGRPPIQRLRPTYEALKAGADETAAERLDQVWDETRSALDDGEAESD